MTALPEPQAGASARPWRNVGGDIFDHAGNEIARVWDKPIYAEGRANARLIAAAPDLLAALTVCMEAIDYAHADPEAGLPSPSWHWWTAAREALAAAQECRTDG